MGLLHVLLYLFIMKDVQTDFLKLLRLFVNHQVTAGTHYFISYIQNILVLSELSSGRLQSQGK